MSVPDYFISLHGISGKNKDNLNTSSVILKFFFEILDKFPGILGRGKVGHVVKLKNLQINDSQPWNYSSFAETSSFIQLIRGIR